MRLATVLTPTSDENLQLSAQCGVSDLVHRYPSPQPDALARIQARAASFGLKLSVIEGNLPIETIKVGQDSGQQVAEFKALLRQMGEAEIPLLCYNFMAGTDWVRTQLDAPERGGAKVSAFRLEDVETSILLGHGAGGAYEAPHTHAQLSPEQLWTNLEHFLQEVIPVAEQHGVVLAMHPDDPPLDAFLGTPRIMNSVASFDRLLQLVPSPSNGICFCQGTFAEIGVEIPGTIRHFGSHIKYVHFRDVRGTRESFVETFHDNGPTDMAEAMRAYHEIGFTGPIRPDHVPQLVGEDDGEPGYTMLGRLFAFGYMRGLMQATAAG